MFNTEALTKSLPESDPLESDAESAVVYHQVHQ